MTPRGPDLARVLSAHEDELLTCVHCGFCLSSCPTYLRLGDEADSPRGRLHLMRAVAEGRLDPASRAFDVHIDRCLGCRACEPVCPSGVPYGRLLEHARSVTRAHRRPSVVVRMVLSVVRRPALMRLVGAVARTMRASGIASFLAGFLPGRLAVPFSMLAATRPVPAADRASAPADGGAVADARANVAMLEGCVQAELFGHVNAATERVLRANGYQVVQAPGQRCCGALHAHAGDLGAARELARRNVAAFAEIGAEYVVVASAGCGAAMRDYVHLLEGDPRAEQARALAARVRDVSELLAEAGPRPGAATNMRAAWDPPCHLVHAQGVDRAPLRVLEAVSGLEVVEAERASECCGGAGVYGLTHPDLGDAIGDDKARALVATGADVIVTANPGCQMQIATRLRALGSRVPVRHLVEILDESYARGAAASPPGPEETVR